ncbi:sulfate permease 2 [Nannizzia gypsea CBS 118893]|uniref:Sulfate permease 2 n=1 Tax=Arthroderma gypseum (strain ATCC MYA-4604 / CBS 118893) TaxID=535722 RepID=E4V028_ARTGP|nr:sulfate permease 2 [Nannizzia gypsea CBS 118893]EFR02965.1 sulfate permease 2 [Nannizzia gypsea CBS 118893]
MASSESPEYQTKMQKLGAGVKKVLGLKDEYPVPTDPVTRGESTFSVQSAEMYYDRDPTTMDYFREITPSGEDIVNYLVGLFPFLSWITRYNVQWLVGDIVAGLTVGVVVVPQGMAYAKLATLPVQFGLYSSFMGPLIYWFFATSKDITIGPVAVVSTLVGHIIDKAKVEHPDIPPEVIASAIGVVAGGVIAFIGLIRCGWIVDFIPLTAISAFMTGSALSIATGQVPALLGLSGFSNRGTTYEVILGSLKHLPTIQIDAAMGLTALFLLYLIRWGCGFMAKRYPAKAKIYFFTSTLRAVFVILLYTFISFLVNRNHRKDPVFKILGVVPRGFQNAGIPVLNSSVLSTFASEIPAAVIVLLLEHIAISKSFGRVNNYTINPSQEFVSIGATNMLGPFLGGYPVTGSFSRTAISSKAGIKTPFGGVFTAMVVLLAIYALPAVFFYIPNSSLSAVIIHAVGDLILPPNAVYQFWKVSPIEVIVFLLGVFVAVFSTIENGIYATVAFSLGILLFRLVKAKGQFLGRVKVNSVIGDHVIDNDGKYGTFDDSTGIPGGSSSRNVFLPLSHKDGSNPDVQIEHTLPGIFIYKFSEGFNYPNSNSYLDDFVAHILENTRRTNPNAYGRPGDRPWNNPGPKRGETEASTADLPTLKAIIMDFSSVNNVDVSSIQNLVDVREQLDRHAAPDVVQWHFAHINNRWTKRALAAAGFGYPTSPAGAEIAAPRWKPVFSVANVDGSNVSTTSLEMDPKHTARVHDEEVGTITPASQATTTEQVEICKDGVYHKEIEKVGGSRGAVVNSMNRPMFHIDLTSALQSATVNALQ